MKNDFLVCDIQRDLPFKEETFNLVTCFEVLEHLTHPMRAIKNLYDVCRDVIVLTTPNKILDKPVRKILGDFDETHINVMTPWKWKEQIGEILDCEFVKIESFFDLNLRIGDKLLFFRSIKIPYLGLNTRILIKK